MRNLKESPAHPGLVILFLIRLALWVNEAQYYIDVAFTDTKSNDKLSLVSG